MKGYTRRFCLLFGLLLVLLGLTAATGYAQPQTQQKFSAPGQYSGYTSPEYKSWTTTSQYVTMRDGVRIAVDAHMPADGPARDKFPTILIATAYHRASVTDKGEILNPLNFEPEERPEGLPLLLSYGYVIVVADVRGTGASFGFRSTFFSPEEQADGNDLLNWIAAQPWSDGNVGMIGASLRAITQLLYAGNGNPALKCIAPRHALLDLYDTVYPGGLPNNVIITAYKLMVTYLDANKSLPELGLWPSKPVDADKDGSLLAEATKEHQHNFDMTAVAPLLPFRDSTYSLEDARVIGYGDVAPAGHLQQIENSGVAIYNMGGWFDGFTRDSLTMMATLSNPSKLLVGPYHHLQGFQGAPIEYLRWFDWCLKGVQNGIDKEPPYYIYTMGRNEWRFADQWPLPEQQLTPYYFGTANSITTTKPAEAGAFDEYLTDYTTTSRPNLRWSCPAGQCQAPEFGDRAELDKKNLTYTTPPLQQDLEVTGHPVVHLFVSSTATDGAFFAYLEDIDENGVVNYISEGELKASLRKLEPRPWKPDLPWHRSYAEDATPLTPGQAEEIVIDLEPTSNVFLKGHSLRVSIAGWDNNFGGPQFDPPPTISMYRDSVRASYIELPIIGPVAQIAPPPSAPPGVVALPRTGSGPEDGGFQWTLVVWLLAGSGAAAAVGGLCIRFAWVSRRSGGQ
jgi:putative CocE/NonD family hydrolase